MIIPRVFDNRGPTSHLIRLPLALALLALLGFTPLASAEGVEPDSSPLSRESALVVVSGASLGELHGMPIAELGLFAADLSLQEFVPVPFQLDERLERVFNEGTPAQFTTVIHDVFGEDDGLLDAHDELAFLFGEGGVRAPTELPWPAGAGDVRIEISIVDPRSGGEGTRWLYLFAGQGLADSSRSYVSWNTLPSGDVETDAFVVEYADRWILDGFRVKAPCGSGSDLIDRVKGRAIPLPDRNEDEEGWNENSIYLGGLVGPVRAIRYVQGAMSGVNTIHHDIISRGSMGRFVDLRVHEVDSASIYIDMRPNSGAEFFSSVERTALIVDGVPETASPVVPEWTLYSSDEGGLVTVYEFPPEPRYQGSEAIYIDDASYDDTIPENPGYGDEDDASFGSHGFTILETDDSNFDPIGLHMHVWPICAGQGDATTGDAHLQLEEEPIDPSTTPQWQSLGAIRSLRVETIDDATLLSWEVPSGGVEGYRVYRARSADLPHGSWNLVYEGPETSFTDDSGLGGDNVFFYSVVAYNGEGEGLW